MTRVISADCHINEPPHVFDGVPAAPAGACPEDRGRRRRRRRLELRRRTAQAQLRRRGHGRARQADEQDVGPAIRRDPARATTTARARRRHGAGRRRRQRRLSGQRDLHLHRARPRARRSRACARTTTGCSTSSRARHPTASSVCRCCRSTTASTCASPSSTACVAKGARGGLHPRLPDRPYHDPVLRPAVRAPPRSGHPAHVPPHLRRHARPRPTGTSSSSRTCHRGRHRVPLLHRGPAVHLHGVRRRVRAAPGLQDRRRRGELRAGCRSGPRRWTRTSTTRGTRPPAALAIDLPPERVPGREPLRHRPRRRHRLPHDRRGARPELADCSMFSTDYPHSVCLWPNSQDHIARLTAGMSEIDTAKMLARQRRRASTGCDGPGATRRDHPFRDRAAIVGVGATEYTKYSGVSTLTLALRAHRGGADRRRSHGDRRRRRRAATGWGTPCRRSIVAESLGVRDLRYHLDLFGGGSASRP